MSKTFCPIPWIMLATRTNGDVRVCCQANQGPTKGLLKDKGGKIYNLKNSKILDTRNASLAKEIRLSMLKGNRHPECIRCWREEDSGMLSRRIQECDMWKEFIDFDRAKKVTQKNGSVSKKLEPIYYDLRLGNLCNLKCRMCFPTESSSWYNEYTEIYKKNTFKDTHGKVELVKDKGCLSAKNKDYDWCLRDDFWKDLESKIKYIKHIYIVGGEPLLIGKHEEFLEKCIKQKYAKNIRLEYNTNITVLSDKILNLWSNFKEVRIGASIDAYGKINEYIRYPSNWEVIEKNLDKLDKIKGNFKVWIACTVMMHNVLYLPEFIKWKLEKKFVRVNDIMGPKPFLTLHPLHTPKYYNIKALPPQAKRAVEKKFKNFLPWFNYWLEQNKFKQKKELKKKLKNTFESYIKYMYQDDWSSELPHFWEYTRKLDKLRNQKIEKSFPELYELIKHTEK